MKPAPNPSASRSYARRVVVLVGFEPASLEPRRPQPAGVASTARTSRASASASPGRRVTRRAQRAGSDADPHADTDTDPDGACGLADAHAHDDRALTDPHPHSHAWLSARRADDRAHPAEQPGWLAQ